MKLCCTCRIIKPLEEFHNHRNAADGKQRRCGECMRAYVRGRPRAVDSTPRSRDPEPRTLAEFRRRCQADERRNQASFDALAAATAAARGL